MARRFKVSTLVMLRRLHDLGTLGEAAFRAAYQAEHDRLLTPPTTTGGSFFPTLQSRVGRRFGRALVISTLGGRTSFSESFHLLGIKTPGALRAFAANLGVVA